METLGRGRLTRRDVLKWGAGSAGVFALGASGLTIARGVAAGGTPSYTEVFPTSPLIVNPFSDDNPLPVPKALRPVPEGDWTKWASPPGPDKPQDHVLGAPADPHAYDAFIARYGWRPGTHQVWPGRGVTKNFPWLSTTPLVYQVPLLVATHSFTNSKVQPIGPDGLDVTPPGRAAGEQDLPPSTIYGFNGKFPGGMINAEYGRPVIVRFENHLDVLPAGMTDADRQDFGSPNHAFLTHLHNGHTGCESDGNPHYTHHRFGPLGREDHEAAYQPGEWVDNLYLNYPAGGDDSEKQSFLWFHDHVHGHTGADVYKGMVGLFPIYDPYGGKDMGDETKGLRLPGRRTNNGDGSFDVEYDIPLAFYDVRLDDGVTLHQDVHNPDPNGEVRPEWWGKTFFQHFPNHGFVGDIFTVNGTAYPVLRVKRRNYRLRFLGASVSRIYDFQLMRSPGGPVASRTTGRTGVDLQGQYQLPDGVQCMQFTQIASEGGLLPHPIVRNSFEIWPAVRREVVVDFKHYQDGSETRNGDVIYLVNTMQMPDGRMWLAPGDPGFDPTYRVPVLKIIIDGDADDQSVMPVPGHPLREAPETKLAPAALAALTASATTAKNGRHFTLSRDGSGGLDGETEWLINGLPFVATAPLQTQTRGDATVWVIQNGGGGWVHPMHLHMEEHRVLERDNTPAPDGRHPDDTGKMDVVSLDPAETVPIYRSFRSFTGPYVAHCHNLAHEDHNMMFGWEIIPADGDARPDQSPVAIDNQAPGDGNHNDAVTPVPAPAAPAAVVPGIIKKRKTVATLSVKVMRSNGHRIVRSKVSDSRRKASQRLTIRVRHGGKTVLVRHPSIRKGHGTIDIALKRSLKGRHEVVAVLDDGTTVRKRITLG